jgi:hypothetical protein
MSVPPGAMTSTTPTSTAKVFLTATPSDSIPLPDIKGLYVMVDGNVTLVDWEGNVTVLAVVAGQTLPLRPQFIQVATTAVLLIMRS